MDPSNAFMSFIEWMDRSTDNTGKVMKTLLLIIAIVLACVWWTELSAFVSSHANTANKAVKTWLIENTPKK